MTLIFRSLVLILLLFPAIAQAVVTDSAQTERTGVMVKSPVTAVHGGEKFWLAVSFQLADGWHIYWRNPGDSGLPPELEWTLPKGFSAGEVNWPAPHRIPLDSLVNYGYEGSVDLLVPVTAAATINPGNTYIISLNLNWLACKDICIPEQAQLMLTLPGAAGEGVSPSGDAAGIEAAVAALPPETSLTGSYKTEGDKLVLTLPRPDGMLGVAGAYFFPYEAGLIDHTDPQAVSVEDGVIRVSPKLGGQKVPDTVTGVWNLRDASGTTRQVIVSHRRSGAAVAQPVSETKEPTSKTPPAPVESSANHKGGLDFWQALFFAFLGGLLLNAMPCVFPVLSLKALAISRKAQGRMATVRWHGLVYTAGVLISFAVLAAIMIALQQSGMLIGWGFQLQSPVFVAALTYLFVLMALSLLDLYHLPMLTGALGMEREGSESGWGSFLTGVLAVLVATPCSVPFMAPAVGYAFAQPPQLTMAILLMLGLGLAFPYLLISFIPGLIRLLPKPGRWMNTFKQFMAFPLLATAIWLLWVLAQQLSADAMVLVLGLCLALAFLIWLGRGRGNIVRVACFALGGVLMLASLWRLAHMTPEPMAERAASEAGIAMEEFSEKRLAELRTHGRPVFVNATAAWCITCKVNERAALRSQGVAETIRDRKIAYLIADWTNRNDEITRFLQRYDRQGVPLYVYFPAKGEPVVLPQLLTESLVVSTLKETDDE